MRISDWSSDVCSSDLCGACPNDVGGLLSRRYGLAGKAGCDRKRTLWPVALSPSGERYGGLPACWLAGVERGVSPQIGRAPCRERVCQYVWISVVAVSLKKKIKNKNNHMTKIIN